MKTANVIGWSLIAALAYCVLGAVVCVIALSALERGRLLDVPWIAAAEQALYEEGMGSGHNTWLRPGCIVYDPDLFYVPKTGSCEFDEPEFTTRPHFTDQGRFTGPKPAGTGIAVIGDSHAMGWGVNDLQTFSAWLQRLSGRPVYNLGVASYGTVRELRRLEKSGIADKVDTVIIQYCNNDYNENTRFDRSKNRLWFDRITGQFRHPPVTDTHKFTNIVAGYLYTLKAPFKSLADRLRRKDFTRHYQAFMAVIAQHRDILRGKRVVVFYSNYHGVKYRNFPSGRDARFPNLHFIDLGLDADDYYVLDNHPTAAGQEKIARGLYRYLQTLGPAPQEPAP
jgi:lysophospholipase L1-like esterase